MDKELNESKYALVNICLFAIFPVFGVNWGGMSAIEKFKNDIIGPPIRDPKNPKDGEIIFSPSAEYADYKGAIE